jgi:hypothetical protein
VGQALTIEYGLLTAALGSVWSASLMRTSIFLGVLSAAGVALGFAVQSSFDTFLAFAMIVVPIVLMLGLATFVRTVELQRESIVYITGMNRIRHFFQESAPASKPYYVLPAHDDEPAIYRSQGTGIHLRPPRFRLVLAVVQMQGIVAVVCGLLAAAIGWVAASGAGVTAAWIIAVVSFVATIVILFRYWLRAIGGIYASIRPISPTPPDEIGAPI